MTSEMGTMPKPSVTPEAMEAVGQRLEKMENDLARMTGANTQLRRENIEIKAKVQAAEDAKKGESRIIPNTPMVTMETNLSFIYGLALTDLQKLDTAWLREHEFYDADDGVQRLMPKRPATDFFLKGTANMNLSLLVGELRVDELTMEKERSGALSVQFVRWHGAGADLFQFPEGSGNYTPISQVDVSGHPDAMITADDIKSLGLNADAVQVRREGEFPINRIVELIRACRMYRQGQIIDGEQFRLEIMGQVEAKIQAAQRLDETQKELARYTPLELKSGAAAPAGVES